MQFSVIIYGLNQHNFNNADVSFHAVYYFMCERIFSIIIIILKVLK